MSRRHIGDGIRRKQSQWYRENHPEGFAVKHVPLEVYEEEEARKNGKDSSDQQGLNSHISLNSQSGVRAPRGRSWPKMADKAFSGLAGDVVRLIGPQSESDPNALLLNFLTAFGNEIGRGPYYQVEGTRHYTNLFNLQVGDTAKARKGTAVDRIRQLFSYVDPEWETGRIRSSLGSGEGVISEVRDPVTKIKDGIQQTVDEGVVDKRLMIFASEFASLLTVMRREGNTLSAVLRDAFDRGSLGIVTKHNQTRSTGALISVVGHITHTELVRHLQETDMASGFANRFLFTCIRRSKLLPTGRELGEDTVAEMARKVRDVVNHAREVGENDGRIDFSFDGIAHWKEVYPKLTADRPGLLGALTARAEAHTVRLALLYALLDKSYTITFEHLTSALAVWAYCDASVQYLFGDKLGDPIADGILSALRGAPDGLTRTEISGIFKRHESASRIAGALEEIERRGLGRPSISETGGRPTETWLAL